MSPGRFLAEHTSYEIAEWLAWFKLEEADRQMAESRAKAQSQVKRGNSR